MLLTTSYCFLDNCSFLLFCEELDSNIVKEHMFTDNHVHFDKWETEVVSISIIR